MDFDFPAIDEMAPPHPSSQPASMHNLLNTAPAPVAPQSLPWNPAPDLPPLPLHPAADPAKRRHAPADPKPQPAPSLDDSPPIEMQVVNQMGGLPYADMCKERAREKFKEMKKNEHMASGDFDRIKRRKKGDTSMTAREKYVRRLRMNQDSAAAARHAQEVYVHVLEKLVKTAEVEKKAMVMELTQLRQENAVLNTRLSHNDDPLQTTRSNPVFDASQIKHYDAIQVAKLVDMLTTPETVSAQDQDPNLASHSIQIPPPA